MRTGPLLQVLTWNTLSSNISRAQLIIIIQQLHSSRACSVNLGETVLLTGGFKSAGRVSLYSQTGFLSDLPQLEEGRWYHGCTFYHDDQGTKVLTSNIIFQIELQNVVFSMD